MKNTPEIILCAANYYNDNKEHAHTPSNITIGFITCGLRHHNCINTFAQIVGFPYNEKSLIIIRTEIQGFLTNKNRFVDRVEGREIAIKQKQVKEEDVGRELFSEDLY